jgi:hypothetical protein
MGVKPAAIAALDRRGDRRRLRGGLTGRAMRRHLHQLAHDRGEVLRRVMAARAVAWSEILGAGFGNPLVVDGEILRRFLGRAAAGDFRRPDIPLTVIAPTCTRASAAVHEGRSSPRRRLDGGAGPGAADRGRRPRAGRRRRESIPCLHGACAARPT